MRAVLFHTRAIVDEHELKCLKLQSRPLHRERAPRGVMEQVAVPATVRGASGLESLVRLLDALLRARPVPPAACDDQTAQNADDDQAAKSDQDYGKNRHLGTF